MGEYADLTLDYDPWMDHGYYSKGPSKNIICKYCRKLGFHWNELENVQFRLFDKMGKMHSCLKK